MGETLFSEALERLKISLGVHQDQEVAAALGMKKSTLAERKQRGAFPEKEVYVLAATRPELGLDVSYVLTGARSLPSAHAELTAAAIHAAVSDPMAAEEMTRVLREARARTDAAAQPLVEMLYHLDAESIALLTEIANRFRLAGMVAAKQRTPAARRASGVQLNVHPGGSVGDVIEASRFSGGIRTGDVHMGAPAKKKGK